MLNFKINPTIASPYDWKIKSANKQPHTSCPTPIRVQEEFILSIDMCSSLVNNKLCLFYIFITGNFLSFHNDCLASQLHCLNIYQNPSLIPTIWKMCSNSKFSIIGKSLKRSVDMEGPLTVFHYFIPYISKLWCCTSASVFSHLYDKLFKRGLYRHFSTAHGSFF